jgi:NAD(P)-dependent dehydrogenase (short-subunit alcohol dehydrogenase family)
MRTRRTMPPPLSRQVVVITGASRGIGRSTARLAAARGARVVLTARQSEPLNDLVAEIRAAGGEAIAIPADVAAEEELRGVAAGAVERYGRIDTWINNAGVYIQGRVQDLTAEEFRQVLAVDLLGVIHGTRCALEVMLPREAGVIVQVSSVAARRGVPYTTPYSAAKGGIEGFTQAARAELRGTGIRLSIVYPATVDTAIFQQSRGKLGVVPKPAGPMSYPEEVARAILSAAETGRRHAYLSWAGPLIALNTVLPGVADRLVHHLAGFTYSDARSSGDNLHEPSRKVAPSERGGWSEPGWRGVTAGEIVRVLPLVSLLGAAAAGFLAARLHDRLSR